MGWNNQGLESCSTWTTDLSTPCREEGSYMLFVETNFIFHNDIIKYFIYKKKYFSATTSCKMNINEKDWLNDTSTCLLVSSEVYLTIIKIKKTDIHTPFSRSHTIHTLFLQEVRAKEFHFVDCKENCLHGKRPGLTALWNNCFCLFTEPGHDCSANQRKLTLGYLDMCVFTCVCARACVCVLLRLLSHTHCGRLLHVQLRVGVTQTPWVVNVLKRAAESRQSGNQCQKSVPTQRLHFTFRTEGGIVSLSASGFESLSWRWRWRTMYS